MSCEWTIVRSGTRGRNHKTKCGKEHTHTDEGGRNLCTHHFNRWYKKKINNLKQ